VAPAATPAADQTPVVPVFPISFPTSARPRPGRFFRLRVGQGRRGRHVAAANPYFRLVRF
jgi:hypothetical protein